jgi:ABC-type transporter Mla maintaining outer membrane lipid asymmetry ATPase subunit MlaF
VLDPAIILFDEPDSGLDPVRTAYLNQLIIDLNAQTDATFLIVTHDIGTAQTVPDNIGMLYRKHLAMFGPTRAQAGTGPQQLAAAGRLTVTAQRVDGTWKIAAVDPR